MHSRSCAHVSTDIRYKIVLGLICRRLEQLLWARVGLQEHFKLDPNDLP